MALRLLVELLHSTVKEPFVCWDVAEHIGRAVAVQLAAAYHQSNGLRTNDAMAQRLQQVASHLSERPEGRGSLAELAALSGLNASKLWRRFESVYGMTPKHYHLTLRLEAARSSLVSGQCTVTQAAYDAGFCDVAHSSRMFKKSFGNTRSSLLA